MKKIFLVLLLLFTVQMSKCFAQSNYYYTLYNEQVFLSERSDHFLVHTNSNIDILHFGNCKIDTIISNLYIIDDTTRIVNRIGIEYITTGLLYNSKVPLFISKDITLLFKEGVSENQRDSIYTQYNLSFIKKASSYELVRVQNHVNALSIANSLSETGMFIYATPDFLVKAEATEHIPNDTYFDKQWYLHNTGQGTNDGKSTTFDADIDAPEAWEITKGSPDIVIAVMDVGVSSNHPDLPNTRQVRLNGSNFASAYDGTGDSNNPSPTVSTTNGEYYHGDACAGIIAATQDNDEGVSGIAPLCKILPVKLPLGEFAPMSLYTDAINFARLSITQIISNSWNGGTESPSFNLEVQAAVNQGKIVVFSASNTANHSIEQDGEVVFPADLNIPNMIIVGASDRNNHQANYSPTHPYIDISAPSNTAYTSQIEIDPYESLNVWTMDIPGVNYGQNKWKDWSTFIPAIGEVLPSTGANYHAYTGRFGGTSAAAPMVAATIALMESVNPCLTTATIIHVLELSADKVGGYDYQWNPSKSGHSKELGFGKLNTYTAVQMAVDLNTTNYDLFMKDNSNDLGLTGFLGTGGGGDKSPDIWVRNQQDGFTNFTHQNPEFQNGSPCYVYVRVTNKSCLPSSGNDVLKLYWSKAATSSSWPEHWDGSIPDLGGNIDGLPIPVLLPGASIVLEFAWNLIDPNANNSWNSCLLARIESAVDNQTFFSVLADDITENNNVSIRNVTIVDQFNGIVSPFANQLLVGNVTDEEQISHIYIGLKKPVIGKPNIFREAEVQLAFDNQGWQLFKNSGALNNSGIKVLKDNLILIKDSSVLLENIVFPPKTRIPIYVQINFLARELTSTTNYEFEIVQFQADSMKQLGTETFQVVKHRYDGFKADAGSDITATEYESVLINAVLLPDAAVYNWFDEADSLIYSGSDFLMLQELTQQYKLEVIRLDDGLKDYDEVQVNVDKKYLKNISPVPVDDVLTVEYDVTTLPNTYLSLVHFTTTTSTNYMLDMNATSKVIDVSLWQTGLYTVYLVSNGVVMEAQTISVIH